MADNFTPFRGRKVDLLLLHPASYVGAQKINSAFVGNDNKSRACTGVQKAAQHWTMEFFTTRQEDGSGTSFLAALKGNKLYSDLIVRQEFNIAAVQAIDNLASEYTDDTPEDEQITEVSITALTIKKGRVDIQCKMTTVAGDEATLIFPVSLAPN